MWALTVDPTTARHDREAYWGRVMLQEHNRSRLQELVMQVASQENALKITSRYYSPVLVLAQDSYRHAFPLFRPWRPVFKISCRFLSLKKLLHGFWCLSVLNNIVFVLSAIFKQTEVMLEMTLRLLISLESMSSIARFPAKTQNVDTWYTKNCVDVTQWCAHALVLCEGAACLPHNLQPWGQDLHDDLNIHHLVHELAGALLRWLSY